MSDVYQSNGEDREGETEERQVPCFLVPADVHGAHRNINHNTLTESTFTVSPEMHLKTTVFNYRQLKTSTVLK